MRTLTRYFSNRTTIFGYLVVVSMFVVLIIMLLLQVDTWSKRGFELVRNNMQQAQLVMTMRDAVQKRVLTVQGMISMPGKFDRDQASVRYYNMAGVYASAREQLLQTHLDKSMMQRMNQLDQAVDYAEPFYNNMVEMLIFEDINRAELQAIFVEGTQASEKVLLMLDRIVELQTQSYDNVIQNYEISRRYTLLGVIGVLALIMVVVTFAVRASSRQFSQASRMSIVDEVTEIYNRRYFDMVLEEEWKRSMREYTPISLLMLDIDYFKPYNDTYGHQKGDECLHEIAAIMSQQLKRASDFSARYGGEEFAIVLPNTSAEHARLLAERIRRAVEDARIKAGVDTISPWLTVSIGVATATAEFEQSSSTLIKAADNCLYQSKREGRNRVTECIVDELK